MAVLKSTLVTLLITSALACASEADLFTLMRNDDVAGLRRAIASGANLEARDNYRSTPLMHAAAFGSLDALRTLIEAVADVNARSAAGASALMWAAGDLSRLKMLVAKGADVNAVSKSGRTPLLAAAAQVDSLPLVRFLISAGANPKAVDAAGINALMSAASAGNAQTVRLLLDAGIDVNAETASGSTALMAAALSLEVDIVKALLAKGANPNASLHSGGKVRHGELGFKGVTPLMIAAGYGSTELVKVLIDAGAKVDTADGRGLSALFFSIASDGRDPRVPELLIARGADVNRKSGAGETPLDWATKFGEPEVLALLKKHSAVKGTATPEPEGKPEPAASVAAAMARSVKLVQTTSASFFAESGCAACHAQNVSQVAVRRLRGSPLVDGKLASEETRQVTLREIQERLLIRQDPPALEIPLYSVFGLAVAGYEPDFTTNTYAHVASKQRADGGWGEYGQPRPPMNSSSMRTTAMALLTLRTYGFAGRKAEFDERFARARKWVSQAECRTTYDKVWKVAALKWAGASDAEVATAASAVREDQRPDGGWAQTRHLSSDAFATGEALWVLYETGQLAPRHAAYQKAADYLLRTQQADGSWHVRSRAIKFQPYFQSGFPHGHDQWISQAATAWATAALQPVAAER